MRGVQTNLGRTRTSRFTFDCSIMAFTTSSPRCLAKELTSAKVSGRSDRVLTARDSRVSALVAICSSKDISPSNPSTTARPSMNVRERQRSSLTLERGESNSLGISTGTSPTLRSVNLSYSPNSPSLHLRRSSVDSNGGSSQQRRRSSGFPTHHFAGFLGDNSLPLRSNTLSTAALKGTRSWHWKVLFTFVLLLCIGGLGGLFAPGSALRQVVRLSTSIAPLTSTAPVAPLASLEERLRRLETLPILSQVDIEPYNREGCPDGQFRREAQAHEFDWMLMDDAFVRSARQGMVDHLRKLERDGAEVVWDPTRHVGGAKRGVVLAGGNAVRCSLISCPEGCIRP